jgi:hypothetical protein
VIVGLVECKTEPGPEADSLDCPRCRNGIRLAQIDEDDIGLCVSDLSDAMRVQVDDVDHYDVSTAAQGRGQGIPYRMNRARDDQPNGLPDFRMRAPQCPCTGAFRYLRPPLGRVTPLARYFIHRPAIRVFGGLLGIPPAMLQGESRRPSPFLPAAQADHEYRSTFPNSGVCCRMRSSPRREAAPGTLGPAALIKVLVSAATG